LVEGSTEHAFLPHLREFIKARVTDAPKLVCRPFDGPIPKGKKLRRQVELNLNDNPPADAVIALTDVYTGKQDFTDAEDAKRKLREWVGTQEKFHAHVALHEFEAWLLPYWTAIRQLSGSNRKAPSASPESVNHAKPPSKWLQETFRTGKRMDYSKTRDAVRILDGQDLSIAAQACPELKALLNTILTLCGGAPLN
jgi:hypothetical protein